MLQGIEVAKLVRRRWIRIFLLPLEFVFRLQRKLSRFILNNAQLSSVQRLGVRFICGNGLSIENYGVMHIGDDFQGGGAIHLLTYPSGELTIGNRLFIGDQCKVIAGDAKISIGDDCLIAEQVSIRASNHGTSAECPMNKQPNIYKDISIGSDVWIGRGAVILAGSRIPDGAVIGANSVVTASVVIERYCIYAGNPAKKIRCR